MERASRSWPRVARVRNHRLSFEFFGRDRAKKFGLCSFLTGSHDAETQFDLAEDQDLTKG